MIASVQNDPVVTSFAGIARLFKVRNDTVRKEWALWLPPKPRGGWLICDLIELVRQRDAARNSPSPYSIETKEVQRRRELAEMQTAEETARIAKFKADQLNELLLPADDVEREIIEWCGRISLPLTQLPDRISNLVPGELKAPVKKIVEAQVSLTLQEAFESGPLGDAIEDVDGSGSSKASHAPRSAAAADDDG